LAELVACPQAHAGGQFALAPQLVFELGGHDPRQGVAVDSKGVAVADEHVVEGRQFPAFGAQVGDVTGGQQVGGHVAAGGERIAGKVVERSPLAAGDAPMRLALLDAKFHCLRRVEGRGGAVPQRQIETIGGAVDAPLHGEVFFGDRLAHVDQLRRGDLLLRHWLVKR
jgi:hypothetical protein